MVPTSLNDLPDPLRHGLNCTSNHILVQFLPNLFGLYYKLIPTIDNDFKQSVFENVPNVLDWVQVRTVWWPLHGLDLLRR